MRRVLKWVAAILGIILVLIAMAVIAILLVADWNWLRGPITERVAAATGRDFAIDGNLDGDLSWQPWIRARDIRLGNAEWAETPYMAEIAELAVRFDLRELIRGQLLVSDVQISGAQVTLVTDAEGRSNWHMDEMPGVPDERADVPLVENLVVEDSRLNFRDEQRDITLEATVASAAVVSPDEGELPVTLEGTGRVQERPFSIALRGGALVTLREPDQPYPVQADIEIGGTHARIDGTLMEPLDLAGMDVELEIAGPSPDELAPILTIPLPATPPYRLAGRLVREGDLWRFENFAGIVGDSDLAGSLSVDVAPERPMVVADLVSRSVDLDDLGTLIGLPPEPELILDQPDETGRVRVLPDAPLQIDQVRGTDAQVTFRGDSVVAPGLPLQNVELTVDLEDAVLRLSPFRFGLAGGQFDLYASIYSAETPVMTDYDLRLSDVGLQEIFNAAGVEGEAQGVLEGRARFSTVGNTVRQAMATADGNLVLVMDGGYVTGSLLQLLDVGFLEALAVVLANGEPAPMNIRCLIGYFEIQDGVMVANPLLLDTEDSVITGEGRIDLGTEALDLRISGEPKQPGIASSRVPIEVGGTFASPSAGVDPTELAVRGGLAVGLGAILAPLAALLPFLDPGLAEDSPCHQLIGAAEAEVNP